MLGAPPRRSAARVWCTSAWCARRFSSVTASSAASSVFSPSVLRGRVAIVTGGTGAIGFAIARLLTQHGARTALLSRTEQRAVDAAADISQQSSASTDVGGNQFVNSTCSGYKCNVNDSQEVDATVSRIVRELGPVSILVNAHGASHDGLLPRMHDEHIRDSVHTNLTSCLFLLRAVSRQMLAHRVVCGSIVTVGSIVAEQGNVGQVAYAASKAGLEGMTRSASKELSRYNVNVNLIAAGWIAGDAGSGRAGMMGASGATGGAGERWSKRLEERDWLGRPGTVNDVANVALFLCTPAASYIQGTVLHVDGGLRV